MSVPMKSHLSPAWTISTASARNITSRLRGRREGGEIGERGGREEGGEEERREGREKGGRRGRVEGGEEERREGEEKRRMEEGYASDT